MHTGMVPSSQIGRASLAALFGTLMAIACGTPTFAEDAQPKAVFDKEKSQSAGLGMPSPLDKFLAIDIVLKGKVNWKKAYTENSEKLDPDKFTDKEVGIPLALGIRIADGVMAVKAHDAELLNQCANDIEKLAKQMGIADSELRRARDVREAANRGEWLRVFMDLAFFQQDIMRLIRTGDNQTKGTLLIVAGWMQGARYTSRLITENYSPDLSNILREPLLAKALLDEVKALPAALQKDPRVARLREEALPAVYSIVNVKATEPIAKQRVADLEKIATQIVKGAVQKNK